MIGDVSVVPNTMAIRPPRRRSVSRATSTGTGEPPEKLQRSDDRSRRSRSGWPSNAISIVGTPPDTVACSASISSSCSAGSNAVRYTIVARVVSAPSTPIPQPAVWNSGIGHTNTSPARTPIRSAVSRALPTIPQWRSNTPFGKPGGARGVLDLHPVPGSDGRQREGRVGFGAERLELLERHHLPQVRQVIADLGDDVRHPVAPIQRDVEQTRTAGLAQHVAQLARLVGRVDRHQHQPGQGGPVLQQDPLQASCPTTPPRARPAETAPATHGPPARPGPTTPRSSTCAAVPDRATPPPVRDGPGPPPLPRAAHRRWSPPPRASTCPHTGRTAARRSGPRHPSSPPAQDATSPAAPSRRNRRGVVDDGPDALGPRWFCIFSSSWSLLHRTTTPARADPRAGREECRG